MKATNKVTKEEAMRLNKIVAKLVDDGHYFLNKRPEDLPFEDYKIIRRELNKRVSAFLKKGTPHKLPTKEELNCDCDQKPLPN